MTDTPDKLAITLEPKAAAKVAEFLSNEGVDPGTCLRLGVRGGGCSGFTYQLALDTERATDLRYESEGQSILVGRDVIGLVGGSRIVWKETLMTSGFDVENPRATAACGCGNSFRVDDDAVGCSEDSGPADASEIY